MEKLEAAFDFQNRITSMVAWTALNYQSPLISTNQEKELYKGWEYCISDVLPSIGGVAQLVRASACHAEGRGFESRHSRHSPYFSNLLRILI